MDSNIPANLPRIVTFGEIMLRLAPAGYQRLSQALPGNLEATFAGAEANVAAGIASLGGNAAFVTALPHQPMGDAAVAALRAVGVDTSHVLRRAEGRMGLYFYEKGASQRPAAVQYDRAGSTVALTPGEAYDWEQIMDGAAWFHVSGITPAISETAAQAALRAMRSATACGVRISLDMNFRSKLWQWHPTLSPRDLAARTVREMLPMVQCFIGGPDDVSLLLGDTERPLGPEESSQALSQAFSNLTHIAMTQRGQSAAGAHLYSGSLYVVRTPQAAQYLEAPHRNGALQPYEIFPLVDRLGVGDAFAAGLIYALNDDQLATDPQRVLEFAVAHGCLCHGIEGDFSRFSCVEVESLLAGNAGGVLR